LQKEFILKSTEETVRFGALLGKYLFPGSLVLLYGDLGTGKTTLTKGIAEVLQISEPITSPTFTIIQEYTGIIPLYHIDTYRIEEIDELLEIGIEEYFDSSGITVIEWPEILMEILPSEYLCIYIKKDSSYQERKIILKGTGKKYIEVLEELENNARSWNR
jgi:tRNA threonylcarbamoyladenosine biosynthesis protein TsaE